MNLQGVKRVERPHGRWYLVLHRWSRCYRGRYYGTNPRPAQRLSGRTKIWARAQSYNRRSRPI